MSVVEREFQGAVVRPELFPGPGVAARPELASGRDAVEVDDTEQRGVLHPGGDADTAFGVDQQAVALRGGGGSVHAGHPDLVDDRVGLVQRDLLGAARRRGLHEVDDEFGAHPRQMPGDLRVPRVIADGQAHPAGAGHVEDDEPAAGAHRLVRAPGEDLPVVGDQLPLRVVDHGGVVDHAVRAAFEHGSGDQPDAELACQAGERHPPGAVEGLGVGGVVIALAHRLRSEGAEVELGVDDEFRGVGRLHQRSQALGEVLEGLRGGLDEGQPQVSAHGGRSPCSLTTVAREQVGRRGIDAEVRRHLAAPPRSSPPLIKRNLDNE